MTLRTEFTALVNGQRVSVAEIARRFGIRRKTAYKWLNRAAAVEPLTDQSRRPHISPTKTLESCKQAVVSLRQQHLCWGGQKLHRVLLNAAPKDVLAPSTITHILRRHGLLSVDASASQGPWKRLEHALPNDLWQMDFKGTIIVGESRCDPLTVLDDHSRYNLVLRATKDIRGTTVQEPLTDT